MVLNIILDSYNGDLVLGPELFRKRGTTLYLILKFNLNFREMIVVPMAVIMVMAMGGWGAFVIPSPVSNHDFEFRHQSGYRIKRLRILPVQSGLWHSLLSAQ